MFKTWFVWMMVFVALMLGLTACGGASAVAINDLPAYPGATELKAGDSRIGATLAQNSQNITALTQASGGCGKTYQNGYSLPKDTTWDTVKKFYDDKLKSAGWSEPSATSSILTQVNQQNPTTQTVIYVRGNQTLSVIRFVEPISKDASLIFSLTTR